jgi:hypothetical protein
MTEKDHIEIPASAVTIYRDGRAYDGDGKDVTEEIAISEQNGATLRHALLAHGLPVSGTRRQRGRRLAEAGVTAEHIKDHHGWQARAKERTQ